MVHGAFFLIKEVEDGGVVVAAAKMVPTTHSWYIDEGWRSCVATPDARAGAFCFSVW